MNSKIKIVGSSFFIFLCGLFLSLFAVGCASVKYTAITDYQDNDKSTIGIRYFDSSAYLLIQRDQTDPTGKKWTGQVLYLPDAAKKRQAEVTCILAVNTSNFTFTNAIISDTSVTVDSSAVPVAVINALATAVGASFGKAVNPLFATSLTESVETTDKWPAPDVKLFKFVSGKDASGKDAWGVVGAYASSISQ